MRNHPGVDSDSRVFDTVLNLNNLVKKDGVRKRNYTPQANRSNPVVHPATLLVRESNCRQFHQLPAASILNQ